MNFKTQQNFCKIKQLNETLYHNQKKKNQKEIYTKVFIYLFLFQCAV